MIAIIITTKMLNFFFSNMQRKIFFFQVKSFLHAKKFGLEKKK